MRKLDRYFSEGYSIFDTCYESADRVVQSAKTKGHKHIKAVRVKTDTPGLKMFVVLVKEG